MNDFLIQRAIGITRQMVMNNHGQIPDWTSYGRELRRRLRLPEDMLLPPEYPYAYLRTKGYNHRDTLERLRFGLGAADLD